MKPKSCTVKGCGARAWQSNLCNLHAFEQHRGVRQRPTDERLAEGKRLLRQRARELGIVLASDRETTRAVAHVSGKVRSPVV